MIDTEFKNCPRCGRQVNVSHHKGMYSISCNCGLCVPGFPSRERALAGWEMVIERYKRNKDEEK